MSRIGIVTTAAMGIAAISAMTILVLPPDQTTAQEKTLKQQIQGAWNLVSCDAKAPWCPNGTGSISLNGNGRYTLVIFAKNRPRVASTSQTGAATIRENVTPEEYKGIAQGTVAQFGTWSVNEADKTITLHTEEGFFPRPAGGSDIKRTIVSITADELRTSGLGGSNVWRRFK